MVDSFMPAGALTCTVPLHFSACGGAVILKATPHKARLTALH